MEDFIIQAFALVSRLDAPVRNGWYDLHDPHGNIILPAAWEDTVKPGWRIVMTMWPIDSMHSPFTSRDKRRPPRYGNEPAINLSWKRPPNPSKPQRVTSDEIPKGSEKRKHAAQHQNTKDGRHQEVSSESAQDNINVVSSSVREKALSSKLVITCRTMSSLAMPLRRPTVGDEKHFSSSLWSLQIESAQAYQEELAAGGLAPIELVRRASSDNSRNTYSGSRHHGLTWM